MHKLTLAEWQAVIPEVGEDLLPLLSPRRSMERRNTYGGAAPEQVRGQISRAKEKLAGFEREMKEYKEALPDML